MDKLCRQLNGGLTILDENELSDKDINNCDYCGEFDYYPNLIWREDKIWWTSEQLTSAENTLFDSLCKECFEELR